MEVFFSLGSDLGDRKANIERALTLMGESFGVPPLRVSPFIETKAEGFDGPDFLNAAAAFDLEMEPLDVLRSVKRIEESMGRKNVPPEYDSSGRRIYCARIIDIDILLFGELEISTPELQIPHPRMFSRDFVMIPLREICADV